MYVVAFEHWKTFWVEEQASDVQRERANGQEDNEPEKAGENRYAFTPKSNSACDERSG